MGGLASRVFAQGPLVLVVGPLLRPWQVVCEAHVCNSSGIAVAYLSWVLGPLHGVLRAMAIAGAPVEVELL